MIPSICLQCKLGYQAVHATELKEYGVRISRISYKLYRYYTTRSEYIDSMRLFTSMTLSYHIYFY